jgi:AmiR/NasT family two-component response regulator
LAGGEVKSAAIPVFRGRRVLLLHKDDRDRQTLEAQLNRLGMLVECRDVAQRQDWDLIDVCFFDADSAKRFTFPWARNEPDIALIAMIGSETPERIKWCLASGVSSFLVKPVRSSGTYLALMQVEHRFAERQRINAEMNEMRERVKSRRIVFKALLRIMQAFNLDEDQAFEKLRRVSMHQQVSIEELSVSIVCGELPSNFDVMGSNESSPSDKFDLR